MTPVLELKNVSKSFGQTNVLRDISLGVSEGEFVALIGASGSGKSTALRLLAGLDRPTSGQILLRGRDVTQERASARNVALMFQSYALYPHLSVYQNIAMPLRLRRLNAFGRLPGAGAISGSVRSTLAEIDTDVQRVADILRLDGLLNRKPGQLSGGQQQRVALARALVREPSAFLLDEPLSNLDTALRASTREEISALHAKTGHAFLLVTHDQADALSMADRVAVMIDGRIAQLARPKDIYNRPASRAVAEFIGAHRMNILSPGPDAQALHGAGAQAAIGVRPEHLALDETGPLSARLENALFQGDETLVRLRLETGEAMLAVLRGAVDLPAPGAELRLSADPALLHGFDVATGARRELTS